MTFFLLHSLFLACLLLVLEHLKLNFAPFFQKSQDMKNVSSTLKSGNLGNSVSFHCSVSVTVSVVTVDPGNVTLLL